jgi:hypothetical protein
VGEIDHVDIDAVRPAVVVRLAAAGSIVPCPHPSLRWRFDLLVRKMSMLLMILLQFEFFSIALDVHCAVVIDPGGGGR